MIEHTSRSFSAELQELTKKILDMGQLDDEQIAHAAEALMKQDIKLARSVISTDDQVDALHREIEEKAVSTIVRRQPMAVDLREIVGALRIASDLERVGDLAENIAKQVVQLADERRSRKAMPHVQRMVQLARDQLARVMQAYERRDIVEAVEVWRKDQELDALNTSLFRELLTYMMENPRNIAYCTHLIFCAKNIERMGDHATNIAEIVHYIVKGRPLSEDRPKADLTSSEAPPLGH